MPLSIYNRTKFQCSQRIFSALLRKARKILMLKEGTISLAVISKNEMREINRAYRGADETTDVLAFDYGEILLCPAHIKKKYGLISKRACQMKMQELFVHGLVHIGGFDHQTEKHEVIMHEMEKKIFDKNSKRKIQMSKLHLKTKNSSGKFKGFKL